MTAPSYVSSGSPVKSVSGAAVSPGLPAGYATNDILILTVHGDESASIVTPSGWNVLGDGTPAIANTATTGNKLYLYWRRATNSGDSPGSIDSGDHTVARIHAFTGCPTSVDPTDFVEFQSTTSDTTTPCPDYTTTSPDMRILYVAGHGADISTANYVTGSSTFDSDFTSTPSKIADDSTTDGAGGGCAVWHGAILNPTVVTGASLAMSNTSARTAYTVALFPATVSPSSTDTSSVSESQSIRVIPVQPDTLSGTETNSITASLTATDTSSGTETQSLSASQTRTDTATGTDNQSLSVAFSQTDTATGVEAWSITASLAGTDIGSGTDSQTVNTSGTSPSGSDSWTCSENTPSIAFNRTETASGSDTQSIQVLVSSSDSVATTESQSLAVALSSSETGTGTDTQSVYIPGQLLAPTNVQVDLVYLTPETLSYTELEISWDSVMGADFYELERNSVVVASNITDTNYVDTGLTYGIPYSYRVRAVHTIV